MFELKKNPLGKRWSWKGELKWLEKLQCYKVDPETPLPEFEKAPSRIMLIMARFGEWNECLLSAHFNVLTLQRCNHPTTHHPGEPCRLIAVSQWHNHS